MLTLVVVAAAAAASQSVALQSSASTSRAPATGMHWGDYDADGFTDAVALAPGGGTRLLRNLGDGTLEDVTALVGLPDGISARIALWGDYDADGALDLYLGSLDGESRLFRQVAGAFRDVTELVGLEPAAAPLAARWIDYDGDGVADLHLTTAGGDLLYHGLGGTAFEPVDVGMTSPATTGVGAAAGPVRAPGANARDAVEHTDSLSGAADTAGTSASGGRTELVVSGATRGPGGAFAGVPLNCVTGLFDQAGGACIDASRTATLGSLYPMSSELNVDPGTGYVRVGTTSTPLARLEVDTEGSELLMLLRQSGDAKLGVTNDGSVVVGNQLPQARLDVNTTGTDDLVSARKSGATWFIVKNDGDVGIGTSIPSSRLEVVGDVSSSGSSGGSFSASNPTNQLASAKLDWFSDTARIRVGGSGAGSTNGLDIQTVSDASLLRIQGDGDVGIGTASPEVRLHVPGGTDVALGGGGFLQLGSQGAANVALDSNEIMARNNGAAAPLNLNVEGGDIVMGGSAVGNVGIGTSSPVAKLEVLGPSGADALRVRVDGTTRFLVDENGSTIVGANITSSFDLQVSSNAPNGGTAGKPGGGSWSNSSDRRLKKNIADLEGALDTLLALRGVTFEYIDPEAINELRGTRTGFIAQEVETVIPDWIDEKPDGMKMLTVRGFEARAVEALRELRDEKDAQIARLEAEVDELSARVARLEAVEADLAQLRASFGAGR